MGLMVLAFAQAPAARAEPVRIYVQGDTQTLANHWNGNSGLSVWQKANASLCDTKPKIDAYVHVGDIVDRPSNFEWNVAEKAYAARFDRCGIASYLAAGNHDYDQPWYVRPGAGFGLKRFMDWRSRRPTVPKGAEAWKGNETHTFVKRLVGTDNWHVVSVPHFAGPFYLDWAGAQIDALPEGHWVIFVRHQCVDKNGVNKACRDFVNAHPKIQVVMSGHRIGAERIIYRDATMPAGHKVVAVFVNFQHISDSVLERWGILATLDAEQGKFRVSPYDPVTGATSYKTGLAREIEIGEEVISDSPAPKVFKVPGLLMPPYLTSSD